MARNSMPIHVFLLAFMCLVSIAPHSIAFRTVLSEEDLAAMKEEELDEDEMMATEWASATVVMGSPKLVGPNVGSRQSFSGSQQSMDSGFSMEDEINAGDSMQGRTSGEEFGRREDTEVDERPASYNRSSRPPDPYRELYHNPAEDCPKLGTQTSNEGKYRFRKITFGTWECEPCDGTRGHRNVFSGKACRAQLEFRAKTKAVTNHKWRFFVVDSAAQYGMEIEYLGVLKLNNGLKTARWVFRPLVYGMRRMDQNLYDWIDKIDFAIQEIPGATKESWYKYGNAGLRFYATYNKLSATTTFEAQPENTDHIR